VFGIGVRGGGGKLSGVPAPIKTNWLTVTDEPENLVVHGFGAWWSHWDPKRNQSFRCIRQGCSCCAEGNDAQVRYVLLVRRRGGVEKFWLELRSRHYALLERIDRLHGTVVGSSLMVKKIGRHRNAPVEVEFLDWKETEATNIERFLMSLGVRLPIESHSTAARPHRSKLGV
jgi:hypothetical protein